MTQDNEHSNNNDAINQIVDSNEQQVAEVNSDYFLQDLLLSCAAICKNEADEKLITSAFNFAFDAHKGVKRKSGEPYIIHPIAVAKIIVSEIGLGAKSVAAALLHDVVEDTDYTVEDIKHHFGDKIAYMVDGLTKLSGVVSKGSSEQAENFKKMLLTLSDDVRVIIIKLADRLHNMRTLQHMPQHKQMKIAGETIYLFAPLAHRLGLYNIKTELEDLSLKYRFPDEYYEIEQQLVATEVSRMEFIEKFNQPIIKKLKDNNIAFEILGRVKSIYSIWKKMKRKQIGFDEIFDLFAIRIVFYPAVSSPEKSQCWNIFSLITDIYRPKPDRIRDWVNIPKANGYEALHCTVMGPEGTWAEVQVRSKRMEDIAERGFAAHWRYKQDSDELAAKHEQDYDIWLGQLREALNNPEEDAVEFLDNFHLNLQVSDIVVFTPKGDPRTMPKGSTVLDFAYDIHSKVGNNAIGAKVNRKLTTLFTEIHAGDQIQILTSTTAKPCYDWLEHVITARAKGHLKTFLRKEKANAIKIGLQMFEEQMKNLKIKITQRVFQKLLPAYNCVSKDQFYAKLGLGQIDVHDIEKNLKQNLASKLVKQWTLQIATLRLPGKNNKVVEKTIQSEFAVAECCNPIPGDAIIGFKDSKGHVVVHKKNCNYAIKLSAQNGRQIVDAKWSSEKIMSYLAVIKLRGIDRTGLMLDVTKIITEQLGVNIRTVGFQSYDGIFDGEISLYIQNNNDLKHLMHLVGQVKGVEKINRVETQTPLNTINN